MPLHLLPRYSFLRFLSPVAVFLFSAVVGVSFAAWLDAPNAPPNYSIDPNCTPPCSQEDFKPMNLGATLQTKSGSATFVGDLTARKFFDYDGSAYFIDPASGVEAGNLSGKLTVGGEVHANGFYDAQDTGYYLDPAAASGFSGKFAGKVGVRQKSPTASLAVNNYYDPSDPGHVKETSGKAGSLGDALYAYTNSTNAAVSAEQANAAGYAIYASGGINYFGGNVGIGTTASATYALNVVGNANATQLCISGDCKSVWPTAPAETDPKVSGGSTNYLTKWTGAGTLGNSAIYDNGNIGIGTTEPAINLAIGDTDTGFKWITDGNFAAYSNNIDRMRIQSDGSIEIGTRGLIDSTGGDGYARVTISNPNPVIAGDKSFDFYLKGGDNGGQFLVKRDGTVGVYPQGYNSLGATYKAQAFNSALNIQSSIQIQPFSGSDLDCFTDRNTLYNYNGFLKWCGDNGNRYRFMTILE